MDLRFIFQQTHIRKSRSLIRRFSVQFIVTALFFVLLFAGVFTYLLARFRDTSYRSLKEALLYYDNRLSVELNTDIASLVETCTSNPDVIMLRTTKDHDEEVHCTVRVRNLLSSMVSLDSVIKGLFLYFPEKDIFLPGYNSGYSISNRPFVYPSFIGDLLSEHMENGVVRWDLPKKWSLLEHEDRSYLIRLIHTGNLYMGAWIDLDELPDFSEFSGRDVVQLITKEDGSLVYAGDPLAKAGYTGDTRDLILPVAESLAKPVSVKIPGLGSRIAISERQSFSEYCFTSLLPQGEFTRMFRPLIWFLLFFILWAVLFFLLTHRLARRILSIPKSSLSSFISQIQNEDPGTKITPPNDYEETAEIIDAFNTLTEEIGSLRNRMYEEQLAARDFELRSLKNQVAPHFLINCLNTIFLSAQDQSRIEITNQIVSTLSSHLRYTLSDRDYVPLSEELEYLENYILLTQYRFPDTLRYEVNCADDVKDAGIFPLILLTLTENSIKTGLIMGEPFLICVEASSFEKEGVRYVSLVHTDSGTGLSETKLDQYNHIFEHPEVTEKGTGIGLYNTAMRLRLLLGPNASMVFRNREETGLEITLTFPYRKYEDIEGSMNEAADR